ncbi:hypothetical protein AHAS_Ahas14G0026000 [Arachis hypogaea]
MEKEIKFKVIKNTLMDIWGNSEGLMITDVGRNKLLLSFKDQQKVLKNGLWSIKGNLLNLQEWTQEESIFWIQLYGVPEEYMNVETARKIGYMIGILDEVEDPKINGVLAREFLIFRATIDITSPLQTGFYLERANKDNA